MNKDSLISCANLVSELFEVENFDLKMYFYYVKKYGEKSVVSAFNELLLRSDDKDLILNKYFDAYFYIELEQKNVDDNTYLTMTSKYGEDKVNNFFNNLLKFHTNVEYIKKKYDKIYFYIDTINDVNNNGYSFDNDVFGLDNVDILKCYLKEIGNYNLLKPEEEKILFSELFSLREKIEIVYFDDDDNIIFYNVNDVLKSIRINEQFVSLKKIVDKLSGDDKVVVEKYINLMKKEFKNKNIVNVDSDLIYDVEYLKEQLEFVARFILIRDKIINANLRLVVSIAKRNVSQEVELLDLIGEGNMGLMRAIKRFDFSKNVKISTYATWWIRQAISKYIECNIRVIRIPAYYSAKISKYNKAVKSLAQSNGAIPTDSMVAEYLGISIDDVEDIRNTIYNNACFSLDYQLSDDEDGKSKIIDMVADDTTTEDIFFDSELGEILHECLSELKEKEMEVLKYRFGFCGGRVYKLEEIGQMYGLTRERIRQIEAQAINKLRHSSKVKKMEGYY